MSFVSVPFLDVASWDFDRAFSVEKTGLGVEAFLKGYGEAVTAVQSIFC